MDGLLLLSHPESTETTPGDFNNLKSDSWKITDSVPRSTETGDEDLIVLINEGHTSILWNVSGDSLVVLLKLDSDALSDGGVWLLSFNSNLLDNNSSCVGGLGERLLPLGSRVLLLVSLISPSIILKVRNE